MNAKAGVRSSVPPLFVAFVALLAIVVVRGGHESLANNYVLLADAWSHGHAWVAYTNEAVDVVPFHGRAYVVEGPAPAILLLPAVFAFGTRVSQAEVDNIFGALAAFALWRACARAGLSGVPAFAATAFGFFGTSLFACATRGDVWFVAHVCAFAFTLLAIDECMGDARGALVAVYALLAAFSRYPLLSALPLYAIALAVRAHGVRRFAAYVASLIPAFALAAWYDVARFGILGDPGYALWFRLMDARSAIGVDMFSLSNVRMQTDVFLWRLPRIVVAFPFVVPPAGGFSILLTSLPFAYAAFAGPGSATILLGLGTLATAIPAFAYYDTGQGQYGMRHALDFEPFLFVLLVHALARRPSRAMTVALFAFAAFGAIESIVWLSASFAH